MQDFYVNDLGYKFTNECINKYINNLNNCLNGYKASTFDFLCNIYRLAREFGYGSYPGVLKYRTCSYDKGFITYYDLMSRYYNLDKSYILKLLKVCDKFICFIKINEPYYRNVAIECVATSPSKLIELLPLSDSQIQTFIDNGQITHKTTVKQVRELVKSLKTSGKDNKVLEDSTTKVESVTKVKFDIGDYDVKKVQKDEFYKSLDKQDLIHIIYKLHSFIK